MRERAPQSASLPEVFQAESLHDVLPGLVHGFTGNFLFAHDPSAGELLQRLLAARHGAPAPRPLMLEQPHGKQVYHSGTDGGGAHTPDVHANPAAESLDNPGSERGGFLKGYRLKGYRLKGYDGATGSLEAPAMLAVRAADCVPVLAVEPETRAYAALHAGWRGAAAGILPNLLQGWRAGGASLKAVRLAFGPAIGVCCYEVGEDCLSRFQPDHLQGAVERVNGAPHLHLAAVLARQAKALGVAAGQIEVLPYCTSCHKTPDGRHPFASYRRSRRDGLPTGGRNAGFIGISGINDAG